MKNLASVVVLAVLFFSVSVVSFAEETGGVKGHMTGKGMMMEEEKEGRAKDMRAMHGMMMKQMMKKSIVATKDGGVVVMVGKKLLKYDRNLNLVKEAEIKVDMSKMKEMMKKKGGCAGCSGCKKTIKETPVEGSPKE